MTRLFIFFLFTIGIASKIPTANMSKEAEGFLIDYCYDCHDSSMKKGRVDLETLNFDIGSDLLTASTWQDILDTVNSGEMPPKKKPQPTDKEKATFLAELSNTMVTARKIHAEDGGNITLRRLNQREYANTLEALIGVRPNVTELPSDAKDDTFDTIGSGLFMSSGQFEQYLKIAKNALELGTSSKFAIPAKIKRSEPEKSYGTKKYQDQLDELTALKKLCEETIATDAEATGYSEKTHGPVKYRLSQCNKVISVIEDILSRPESESGIVLTKIIDILGAHHAGTGSYAPHPNQKTTLRVRAAAYEGVDPRFNYVEVLAKRQGTNDHEIVATIKVTAPINNPEIIEIPIDLEDGQIFGFRVHGRQYHGGSDDLGLLRKKGGSHTPMGVWIDWVEVEYSEAESGYTPQLARLLLNPKLPKDETSYAKAIIKEFTSKAFRTHPADNEFTTKLLKAFQQKRKEGLSKEKAMLHPLALVMTSPSFLYMQETSSSKRVNPYELAVRLSYFLWSSPPDEELFDLAKSGAIRNPTTLFKQVDRMLDDPRSMHFIKGFCRQWLGMDRLGLFPFNTLKHRGYDKAVMNSSKEELFQSFKYMIDQDLPIRTLLDPDYIIINQVLADHYEMDTKLGHGFEKVIVPKGTPRGGFLGMAVMHAIGSNGDISSPVERGVWVLENILGQSPPPPPPNVPQLDEVKNDFMSNRDLIKMHREAPQCAQCHDQIDPVGLGLEQFDAASRWRTHELVTFDGKTKKLPVDPRGQLPSGETFNDFYELRAAVAENEEAFARVLIEELISYGLGRSFQFIDEPTAEEVLEKSSEKGFRFKEILKRIILSNSFQTK